ncbi:MAG: type II toxin-antitoxin system RatA family toxin [Rhizobiales bacterium]|nr:type II toxin-antitoxin system RatA family toxin [Hyphomicrobiales bacterium]
MPVFQTSKRVLVPADVAYEVASDVAAYREFLPLMQRSVIRSAKTPVPGGETFAAELSIAYPKLGLSESFTSRVEINGVERTVRAISSEPPFRSIEAQWKITPVGNDSDVAIRIDYAFRSPLLQLAAGGLMPMAVQKVMAAFEERARVLQRRAAISR